MNYALLAVAIVNWVLCEVILCINVNVAIGCAVGNAFGFFFCLFVFNLRNRGEI